MSNIFFVCIILLPDWKTWQVSTRSRRGSSHNRNRGRNQGRIAKSWDRDEKKMGNRLPLGQLSHLGTRIWLLRVSAPWFRFGAEFRLPRKSRRAPCHLLQTGPTGNGCGAWKAWIWVMLAVGAGITNRFMLKTTKVDLTKPGCPLVGVALLLWSEQVVRRVAVCCHMWRHVGRVLLG